MFLNRKKNIVFDLIILLVLAIIPFLFQGREIIFNSIIDVCLDPVYYFVRSLYLWNSQELAGTAANWGSSLLFPFGFFFVLFSLFELPAVLVERMWFIFVFFLSGISMYYLFSVLTVNKYRFAKMVSAIFYMYNLYVFIGIQGASVLLLPYAVLPLMLGVIIRGVTSSYYLGYAVVLALASTLMSFINPPLVVGAIIVLVFYLFYYWLVLNRSKEGFFRVFRLTGLSLFLSLVLNLWIILPIVYYLRATHGVELSSILSEKLTWINSSSSFLETFRLLGIWYFYLEGAPGVLNFSYSPLFRHNPLFIFTSFVLPVLALSTFLIKKPHNKYLNFFGVLIFVAIPLAVGTYPPQKPTFLGKIFFWAYQNIPFFNVFKDNYRPFVGMIALSYSVLLGFSSIKLYRLIKDKFVSLLKKPGLKKRAPLIPALLIIGTIFINSISVIAGNMFYEKMKIKEIPDYWYESADWLNDQPEDFRVFFLPEQRFALYTWGHTAGEPASALYEKPQIFSVASVANRPNIQLINMIYESANNDSVGEMARIAGLMNIKYILQRNDFDWELSVREVPPEKAKLVLDAQEGLRLEKNFGELDFYKVSEDLFLPHFYIPRSISYLSGGLRGVSDVLELNDQQTKLGMYLKDGVEQDDEDGILLKRADDIFVKAELENEISEEQLGVVIRPEEIFLPALRWEPGSLFYQLALKKEEFNKWKARKDPENLIDKRLFYAGKRIGEMKEWQMEDEDRENVLGGYREEMEKIFEILEGLEEDERFLSILMKVKSFLWGHQNEMEKIGGESWSQWIDFSEELDRRIDRLEHKPDFSHLVYKFDIPLEGRYQVFFKSRSESWAELDSREFEMGSQHLVLPFSRISDNLIDENLKLVDYYPNSFYRISFDYRSTDKKAKFFIAEGKAGKRFETILPTTGEDFRHFEMLFKSSLEAEKATVFLSIPEEKNLEVRRIIQPEVILKMAITQENKTITQTPKLTFTSINPIKYKVRIQGASEPYTLIFNESFHPDWRVYLTDYESKKNLTQAVEKYQNVFWNKDTYEIWGKDPIAQKRHYQVNAYANSWYIIPEDVEGRQDYELIIEFWPQRLFYYGAIASLVGLAGCLVYLALIFRRKNRKQGKT